MSRLPGCEHGELRLATVEVLRLRTVPPILHSGCGLLRIAAAGLAVLVFILIDLPTGLDVLLIALGLVVVLAVIEFLDQAPELPTSAGTTT